MEPAIAALAKHQAQKVLASHVRVRTAAGMKGVSYSVKPQLPADLLGLNVLMSAVVA